MKIKRDNLSKYFARFGLIIMAVVVMIPMLCSMAFPVTFTISNPDNIPYEYDSFMLNQYEVSWGSHSLPSSFGAIATITDGVISFLDISVDMEGVIIPDGQYVIDTSFAARTDATSQTGVTIANPDTIGEYSGGAFIFTLGDDASVTVQNFDVGDLNIINTLWLHPYEAPPTPTDSITSVWTGIMNWITSSLNTVQGLFYQIGTPFSDIGVPSDFTYNGYSFNTIPTLSILGGDIYYNGVSVYNDIVTSEVSIDGVYYLVVSYNDIPYAIGGTDDSAYIVNDPLFTLGPYSLTFLGTITVIGVSIALGFLLIGVIQRFLKLRG